ERQKVYMVQRIGWYYNDEQDLPTQARLLQAFRGREAAESYAKALAAPIDSTSGENPFPQYLLKAGRPLGEVEPSFIAQPDECGLPHPPVPTRVVASGHDWADADWWARCREQLARVLQVDPGVCWRFWAFFELDVTDRFEVVETFLD